MLVWVYSVLFIISLIGTEFFTFSRDGVGWYVLSSPIPRFCIFLVILNSSQEVKFIDEFCNANSYSHCSLQCLKYSHIINTLRHTSVEYIL